MLSMVEVAETHKRVINDLFVVPLMVVVAGNAQTSCYDLFVVGVCGDGRENT